MHRGPTVKIALFTQTLVLCILLMGVYNFLIQFFFTSSLVFQFSNLLVFFFLMIQKSSFKILFRLGKWVGLIHESIWSSQGRGTMEVCILKLGFCLQVLKFEMQCHNTIGGGFLRVATCLWRCDFARPGFVLGSQTRNSTLGRIDQWLPVYF